jgi:16S rRNA (guanine966-N2)-methyltransferase
MRIIAGTKRGMKLQSPSHDVSRPILDRVKESLFSVLYAYDLPAGALVADLFSGVGSLGLEALSRGAEFVSFIEQDARIRSILEKNIVKAGFVKETKVIATDAFRSGAVLDYGRPLYDLVFVDPPYPLTMDVGVQSPLAGLMMVLASQVADHGILSVRTDKKVHLSGAYGVFRLVERRVWGTMAIGLFKRISRSQQPTTPDLQPEK